MRTILLILALFGATAAVSQVMPEQAVEAVRLAGDDKWEEAEAAVQERLEDQVTADVVEWLRLRAGEGDFAEYRDFLARRPDWPGLSRIRSRGEEVIPEDADPGEVLLWYGDIRPRTGIGAVRLAQALEARGLNELAQDVIETAWVELRLTEEGQEAILERYSAVVEPKHPERVDNLLWRWRTEEAGWMLDLLPDDQRALAEARIAYIRNQSDLDEKVQAVPPALRDTPALQYDRFNWLADRRRYADARDLALSQSTSAEALGQPFRWSSWRRSIARREMREGSPQRAYRLASEHFLTEGSSFADLEWLAGYIALTYLNEPGAAIGHFQTARAAVDTPISIARMEYWTGRAFDVLGMADATAAYQRAAEHQSAFYGLMASEKLSRPLSAAWTGQQDDREWRETDLFENELVRAALTLLEAGERGAAVTFFAELGRTLDEEDLARLGGLLDEMGESFYELILGKQGVVRGVIVPSNYFPIHDLVVLDLPSEPELALSIARRESEFNAVVGSPVGALGLMQLMPATAEEVAGSLDLPYSRNRLTADWQYNARLGAQYLQGLEDRFGFSPVQIAAGYNAGPSRPEAWMSERGDPRLGDVDVIDWIEHIPFRETRNYVMRVTESIPIYQARLTGEVGPVQFTELLTGFKPLVRPIARPDFGIIGGSDGVVVRSAGDDQVRPRVRP
ncbi:soluble lytic murein transglycosylase [Cognatiyoonia sediminum]|uniref:Soluble lytic murein transglycosylase n=1 Tax=Cognatiyoonia sediminum TaxID=1508389 RepID=A0A1M5PUN6_9RHOB|nr:lytic transglycosylase domain-containing protein [Cognatiyoonia sediminum]SHH04983.1 soluble lytic murein transglycosylase [Cognatiyoonia sediminum]